MDWKTWLAYLSGSVDEALLLRNEYLVTANRILRDPIQGRVQLMDVLWATGFFATEVWTLGGLVTFYVLFLIRLDTSEVHIASITSHPNEGGCATSGRHGRIFP